VLIDFSPNDHESMDASNVAIHPRQRGLPDLAGTDQGDRRLTAQGGLNDGEGVSLD
jgi:hypothetical protein